MKVYNELIDCLNNISNEALDRTRAQLKAKNMNLYKQYHEEVKIENQKCIKKYLVDNSAFSRAEKAQCTVDKMIDLSVKYDKILNHKKSEDLI